MFKWVCFYIAVKNSCKSLLIIWMCSAHTFFIYIYEMYIEMYRQNIVPCVLSKWSKQDNPNSNKLGNVCHSLKLMTIVDENNAMFAFYSYMRKLPFCAMKQQISTVNKAIMRKSINKSWLSLSFAWRRRLDKSYHLPAVSDSICVCETQEMMLREILNVCDKKRF